MRERKCLEKEYEANDSKQNPIDDFIFFYGLYDLHSMAYNFFILLKIAIRSKGAAFLDKKTKSKLPSL